MIYQLTQVTGDIDKIYDVPLFFLKSIQKTTLLTSDLFPEWFKPVYNRCPGVKDKFNLLLNSFKKLSKKKQVELIHIYETSKDIQKICSETSIIYIGIDNFDKSIRIPFKNLFEFLFNETIGTDTFKKNANMHIDDHYAKFQELNDVHVCPFCGLETYTLPEFRRAEYDHYLPISIYPWLGANFNNLVPMGDHCNGKKNDKNILYSNYKTKTRRAVWYPYEFFDYTIALKCKKKPSLVDTKGEWEVVFNTSLPVNNEKIKTWNQVFEIPLRFNGQIRASHKGYIEDFAGKNNLRGKTLNSDELIFELKKYREYGIGDKRIETMAVLKEIWADYYINTNELSQLEVLINHIKGMPKKMKP